VHLVGCSIGIHYDARTYECQIEMTCGPSEIWKFTFGWRTNSVSVPITTCKRLAIFRFRPSYPREVTRSAYSRGGWVVGIKSGPENRENLLSVPGIERRFYDRLVRSLVAIQSYAGSLV